ncbi:MAG TPA: cytochrome c family protein [Patescibacteria group bacterium]|nr:cytochrome c family protein [Patescibacteria group bacterium]
MSMEFNKLLAAILVAGIIAMLAGFVSHQLYHPRHLEKNAFEILAAESGSGETAAAEQTEPEPIDLAAADVAKGEKLAKVCASCHSFESGGPNKVGPNLFGIVGAAHAHKADFAYSDAMKAEQGKKWDYDALNKFLWSPRKAIPGTKMTFAGIKKPEERAAVIKWLETQK